MKTTAITWIFRFAALLISLIIVGVSGILFSLYLEITGNDYDKKPIKTFEVEIGCVGPNRFYKGEVVINGFPSVNDISVATGASTKEIVDQNCLVMINVVGEKDIITNVKEALGIRN